MIEFLSESKGNLLVAKATEKLTVKDYEESFIPALNKLLEEYKKIRIVFYLAEGFRGWELGAAWDDAKFGFKHRNDMEKIAVVGGPKWVEWSTKIGAHLIKCEVKTYNVDDLNTAVEWIKN
ncbi:MAG: STAS/SEC14 domain-containing protein [bacterium]|nr:STAS/SEC14 domain-containing protein [bacterium]